ncbi:MAG: IS630 family transposase [Verrucomicrobia bacterium]|nr:IS630 family transposase [Verrucomicrobiota bacterium]
MTTHAHTDAKAASDESIPCLRANECKCPHCRQQGEHPDKQLHHQLNLLLSHLSEQQRRWVAAYEAKRLGWGGQTLASLITGMSRRCIIRGQRELDEELRQRPSGRARVPGAGRHPKLTESNLKLLEKLLSQGATAHGWLNNLWTAKRVAKVIQKHLGVVLCIPSVRKVLNERLGWTLQKPRLQSRDRDEDEITRWKTEEFTRIRTEALDRHAYLAFIDESGFMLAPTLRRTYAPSGHAPVETVTDPHAKISIIGAITLTPDYQRVNLVFDLSADNANFNGQSIAAFLRLLRERVNNPITVIWDSVRIHLSQPVTDYLSRNGNIVSETFPPNAPELNPADGVWSHIKYGRLPNYTPFGLSELRRTVTSELKRLQRQPHLLRAFIRRTKLSFEVLPV